ncbi:PDDEXK nuclease domain-containing protein [uncultured Duncaniella sp.]|uniref:PDDEXK nuclease domain-containing protein n=1 Tax=uncultured Duncaniella sp. TaxID=2768039 RepID=UPI000B04C000|nr:PDDEXK nuclease domain-containing protein [uncultured Duncaniella sp.]
MSKLKKTGPLLSPAYDTFVNDVKAIVENGLITAYSSVNSAMVSTYWKIGRRIVEEEQQGSERAEYGKQLINELSKSLTLEYGQGYSPRYLRAFRQFYLVVPSLEIWKSRFPNLTWTHIYRALRVSDPTAIRWYLETAASEMWSVRTLGRNISSQYYERHFVAPQIVKASEEDNGRFNNSSEELLKSPIIAEFLGMSTRNDYNESELETAIIDHIQDFIMEMGKGFAFMKRQQLIRTGATDYYIDLVFYNVILKCYVLVDLKTKRITHNDVGQMDMYVRMYDELKRTEGDNPTIGIVLCEDTDEDIARYSVLHDNDHLFASKYMLYMPTPEQLRAEIERQKAIYYLKAKSDNEEE